LIDASDAVEWSLQRRFLKDLVAANKFYASRNRRGLRLALEHAFPRAPDIDWIDGLIALSFGEPSEVADLPPASLAFADRLARDSRMDAPPESRNRLAGLDFDFLGELNEIEDWPVARFLSCLRLRGSLPTRKAAVIGTMRDDGIYAIEWIAHYQELGFDPIVIYSNDNADGSEWLLRTLAEQGQIIFVESFTSGRVRPEVKAFEHAFHFVDEVRASEWALWVDSDELFVPAPRYDNNVGNLLESLDFPDRTASPSAVLYNWLWFNSGMIFERRPGTLMERFRYATPNWLTKPLVRVRDLLSMRLQHVPEMFPGATVVDSSLAPFDLSKAWQPRPPVYEGGRLNHYWPKSFQEYSLKKARGDALPLEDDEYRRGFSLFFQWNAPETPDTLFAPDEALLARVATRREALRALPGVREAESVVEKRFGVLLDRYRSDDGLERIYQNLLENTPHGLQPTA
jgi:hypothetical protein